MFRPRAFRVVATAAVVQMPGVRCRFQGRALGKRRCGGGDGRRDIDEDDHQTENPGQQPTGHEGRLRSHQWSSKSLPRSLSSVCGLPLVRLQFLDGDEKLLLAYLWRADDVAALSCDLDIIGGGSNPPRAQIRSCTLAVPKRGCLAISKATLGTASHCRTGDSPVPSQGNTGMDELYDQLRQTSTLSHSLNIV
jgi:hypothetical protein